MKVSLLILVIYGFGFFVSQNASKCSWKYDVIGNCVAIGYSLYLLNDEKFENGFKLSELNVDALSYLKNKVENLRLEEPEEVNYLVTKEFINFTNNNTNADKIVVLCSTPFNFQKKSYFSGELEYVVVREQSSKAFISQETFDKLDLSQFVNIKEVMIDYVEQGVSANALPGSDAVIN